VYYRPPDQDEAFYRQLKVNSQSQAVVLIGDFNHPDIRWEDHTASTCSPGDSCRASVITF